MIRTRDFRLPLGIYRTDATIGAALAFGMDPSVNPWNPRAAIAVSEHATWDIDHKMWWSIREIASYMKRKKRQAQGALENAAVEDLFAQRRIAPEHLPRTVEELVLAWTRACPASAHRLLRNSPYRRAALENLKSGRDWSAAEQAPQLLFSNASATELSGQS